MKVIENLGGWRERAERAESRVKELDAIVACLPKTADGVPIYPGMRCWYSAHRSEWDGSNPWVEITSCVVTSYPIYNAYKDSFYSTREAAEAAAKGGGK